MSSVRDLVDRGIVLRVRIAHDQEELEAIEERLIKIGLTSPHEPLADPERDGRRWFARGSQQMIPIIFTADKLIGSVKDDGPHHRRISQMAGDKFPMFFRPVKEWKNLFKDGKQFRTAARDHLGEIKGPAFVAQCLARDKDNLPKSDNKIEWDSAEVLG